MEDSLKDKFRVIDGQNLCFEEDTVFSTTLNEGVLTFIGCSIQKTQVSLGILTKMGYES